MWPADRVMPKYDLDPIALGFDAVDGLLSQTSLYAVCNSTFYLLF